MDALDIRLLQAFHNVPVAAHNAAFRQELQTFLLIHRMCPTTKFSDLPPEAQSEIARKAAVNLSEGHAA